jgi:hypothetical protein
MYWYFHVYDFYPRTNAYIPVCTGTYAYKQVLGEFKKNENKSRTQDLLHIQVQGVPIISNSLWMCRCQRQDICLCISSECNPYTAKSSVNQGVLNLFKVFLNLSKFWGILNLSKFLLNFFSISTQISKLVTFERDLNLSKFCLNFL